MRICWKKDEKRNLRKEALGDSQEVTGHFEGGKNSDVWILLFVKISDKKPSADVSLPTVD